MLTRPIRPAAGPATRPPAAQGPWDTELLLLRGESREGLKAAVRALADTLRRHPDTDLTDLAYTLHSELRPGGFRLALVAATTDEAVTGFERALQRLDDPRCTQVRGASGLYYTDEPLHPGGKIAVLFPGEGAQYLGMLGDLRQTFPEVETFFADCDAKSALQGESGRSLTGVFLPPDGAGPDELARAEEQLRQIDHAMISVMMADWALHLVLQRLGVSADVVAGHSMGELVALWAAGCVEDGDDAMLPLTRETMKLMRREEESGGAKFVLLAVGAGQETLAELIAAQNDPRVLLAMDNCSRQTVLVGPPEAMTAVEAELQRRRVLFERLPFHRPYHTPLFAPMIEPVRELFRNFRFHSPRRPVYSCTTARPFPDDPEAIRELAVAHWAAPVRFSELIRNLYDDGVRLFIESGPRGNLSAFVEDILRGHPFLAMPANVPRRSGPTQLNHLLGALASQNVPLDFAPLYENRVPRRLELPSQVSTSRPSPVVAEPPPRLRLEEPPPVPDSESHEPPKYQPSGHLRTQVMSRHLEVMGLFLDHQREVTELFLNRSRGQRNVPSSPIIAEEPQSNGEADPAPARPLLGEFLRHDPGRSLVMRRVLDLRDDHFAAHHTVGGREISKVEPDHYGVPVVPMTFTLEMMAEAAAVLVPGLVVTSVRDVRLYRWLAFDEQAPTVVEVTARVEPQTATGEPWRVVVEVRDFGPADRPKESAWLAAQGTVVLADSYPPAPPCLPFQLTNEHPSALSVERTYHNLFHGPLFQGVRANVRSGDEGIESRIEVLPRDHLFRSIPDPDFLIDPVLFDVVMHPLAAWHLIQPDQAGRIMLPIGVESLEVFGPPPAPGTLLTARSWVTKADARSFLHQGEALTEDGSVVLRLNGVKCWRFYVPFGQVNFHGPKDQYFLSHPWRQVEPRRSGAAPFALVRLEPPVDLNQGSMLQVTAKVTLAPSELREYRRIEAQGDDIKGWLFDRNAAKDAIRLVWHEMTGDRLFPSDIEVEPAAGGHFTAHRRGTPDQSYPSAAVDRAGAATVAVSVAGAAVLGLALAAVGSPEPAGEGPSPLDAEEERLLSTCGGEPAEASLRFRCARRAAARAAGLIGSEDLKGVRVRGLLPGTGTVLVAVPGQGPAGEPETWRVETDRDGKLIVAWTTGDREVS